jgi:hypothetical protein
MIRLNMIMTKFERTFLQIIREDDSQEDNEELCRSTYRTDKLGNRVEVPYGGTYAVGKNGRGKGIRKGNTAKEDATGQVHELEPGQVLKTGSNGSGVAICPGESTSEKKGQIVVNRKKPKMESRKLSCLEMLKWGRFLV